MCLNIFSYKSHPRYKLIIAANRDEFYARATQEAHCWKENPDVLAGKDLQHGGTWLGISKTGNFSFITNYRDPRNFRNNAPSRGNLVSSFLTSGKTPYDFLKRLKNTLDYNGYNLIAGNLNELYYFSNVKGEIMKLENGFYGLSNAFLETPWRKLIVGKKAVEEIIKRENFSEEDLFNALLNEEKTPDNELPSTGVAYEVEKLISSPFIRSEVYGTVCSTVVLIDNDNLVRFFERTYNPLKENKTVGFEFQLEL